MILFSHSYFYRFDPKQWKTAKPYPPLGTLFAASFLREKGYDVSLFDTNLSKGPDEIIPILKEIKPKYFVIYDDGFNYLTKMCLTNMREAAFKMISYAKEIGCKVIVSSSDSSDHYEKYLSKGADYVIIGEAEISLLEIINNVEKSTLKPEEIKGIAFNNNGEIIKNPKRPIITDLDNLPMPAWDLVNIDPYKKIWQENHGYFSLNIATTRGCPFKCNWCAKPIYGNRYNSRSPQKIIDEISYLLENFQPTHFWMSDDIFGLKPGWVQEFNKLVQERKFKFKYTIQSRVDLLLKEDTIDVLASSGLHKAWMGAESGSQKILDAMDKGTSVSQIHEATKILKSKSVKVAFFLQFGYLGETKEDIKKTLKMVLDLMPDEIGASISYPLPGTKFYEKVKDDLRIKSNWSDSDDLAMMFQGTFSKTYYRILHRYLHKIYRRQKGFLSLKKLFLNPRVFKYEHFKNIIYLIYYIPVALFGKIQLKRLERSKN